MLSLLLRGPETIDLTATGDGSEHLFYASAATTSAWAPGVYRYAVRATRGDDVRPVVSGSLEIIPDIALMEAGALVLSHARIVLNNINAVIEKRATQDQQKYVINNRELWRTPIPELLKLREVYMAEVRMEDRAACGNRGQFGPALRVRF